MEQTAPPQSNGNDFEKKWLINMHDWLGNYENFLRAKGSEDGEPEAVTLLLEGIERRVNRLGN